MHNGKFRNFGKQESPYYSSPWPNCDLHPVNPELGFSSLGLWPYIINCLACSSILTQAFGMCCAISRWRILSYSDWANQPWNQRTYEELMTGGQFWILYLQSRKRRSFLTDSTKTFPPRCLSPDCQMAGQGCDKMTCMLGCLLQGKPYGCLLQGKPYQVPLLILFWKGSQFFPRRFWWRDLWSTHALERKREEQNLINLGWRRGRHQKPGRRPRNHTIHSFEVTVTFYGK